MIDTNILTEKFAISPRVIDFFNATEPSLSAAFARADDIAFTNQAKVLWAMQDSRLADTHFAATTGYGYNDLGRDVLEEIYAKTFGTQAALVRPQIISGTHALACALFGNLRPGDTIVSATGKPYDTLLGVIGITPKAGSLAEYGVCYKQVDMIDGIAVDFNGLARALESHPRMVIIQRSKGYDWRKSLSVAEIAETVRFVKDFDASVLCMIDNCYGEFVEAHEPTEVCGADAIVGSLIKNPGGGLAPAGGYIAGSHDFVENTAHRLSAPGIGSHAGPTLGVTPAMLQGFYLAPSITAAAVKTAVLASEVFARLGFDTLPNSTDLRTDIVQAIKFENKVRVIEFCRGIQRGAAVDSFVSCEPWDMPGYDCPVIMASGSFISGSSVELSADAPIRPPYIAFFQGGLTASHGKIGLMIALNEMFKQGLVSL